MNDVSVLEKQTDTIVYSEGTILGVMILYPDHRFNILNELTKEQFTDYKHKKIFEAIDILENDSKIVNLENLITHLSDKGLLETCGGKEYIVSLLTTCSCIYPSDQIKELKDFKTKKELQNIKNEIEDKLKNNTDTTEILQMLNNETYKLTEQQISNDFEEIEQYTRGHLKQDIKSDREVIKTGYKSIDNICNIQNGALTVIAGRPMHGKTTFMLNLLINMLKVNSEKKFIFFSYEEARKHIVLKIIKIISDIEISKYELIRYELQDKNYWLKAEWKKPIEDAWALYNDYIQNERLIILNKELSINELTNKIRYLKHKYKNIGGIFIDYIQKIRTKENYKIRQMELQHISAELLKVSKVIDVPVIVGAQFNREVKEINDVTLDKIRECGDIEQDANLMLGLWNGKAVYNKQSDDDFYIKILKNRNGKLSDSLKFDFIGETLNIKDKIDNAYNKKKPYTRILPWEKKIY